MGYFKRKAAVIQIQNVCDDAENFLDTWVYHESFEEVLQYIAANNLPIIPLDDIVAYMKGEKKLKIQSFSLTFDSGFLELYTLAFPLLKKYGFPATFFISPEFVGITQRIEHRLVQHMNWDQIRELEQNGMGIGFYGCKGGELAEQPVEEIVKEARAGKAECEKEINSKVLYYGIKEGMPSAQVTKSLKEEGFQAIFSQAPTKRSSSAYAMGRIQIDDNDLNIFLVKTSRACLFFKDSRFWKYLRLMKIDRVSHFISDTINRLKGKEVH